MNSEKEIDIDSLIEKIFDNEPKEPCSIQLSLEENIPLSELSDLLTYITTMGIKRLFSVNGSKIKLSNMTDEHINLVKTYVKSFGFDMKLTVLSINEELFNYKYEDEKENLSDYSYTLNTDDKKYIFSFEHIRK
jgi:hypothetical protein